MNSLPWNRSFFLLNAQGPGDSDDGCDHSDHSEDSGPDSPDTDAG